MSAKPRKAVVCGTKFGRFYLSALAHRNAPFVLSGIVGQGSARTEASAQAHGVPVYPSIEAVPKDIDVACVVIGGAANGGVGSDMARAFLARGVHVLQEHPVLPTEIHDCYRAAKANTVQWALNTHYVSLEPIRAFIDAAQRLRVRHSIEHIDASCSIQVAYALFDVLGQTLGSVNPVGFAHPIAWDETLSSKARTAMSYRSVEGVFAGVPFTLRIQNELDPNDPDNYSHHLMQVTLASAGGTLRLVDTHGPVVWAPRLHLPASAIQLAAVADAPEGYLDLPCQSTLWECKQQTQRTIYKDTWPKGLLHAMIEFDARIACQKRASSGAQYTLAVCEAWQKLTRLIGFPELRSRSKLDPHGADIFERSLDDVVLQTG